MVTGTILLAIGMLICSWIIESCTTETLYRTAGDTPNFGIVWLQIGETVNDQVLNSYAIFGPGRRDSVLASEMAGESHTNSMETAVCIGTAFGIAGFIMQFVGLRAVT